MPAFIDVTVDVAVDVDARRAAYGTVTPFPFYGDRILVDVSGDVTADIESHRAFPIFAGTPPEEEGYTCGLMFAGEYGADGSVDVVYAQNGIASDFLLGDETDWTGGAVVLSPITNIAEALRLLNLAISQGGGIQVAAALPLGDDIASDGSSLWDGGVVDLEPGDSTAFAISQLNQGLKVVSDRTQNLDGFHIVMGDIDGFGDGDWQPGAVPIDDTTLVSEAVDRLNEVLGRLVPSQPPVFPNGALSVANTAGSSPRLASGVTNNAGSTTAAGTAVTRITAAGVSSNTFNDVGPGDSGTVEAILNGVSAASRVLTGSDNGTYAGLVIGDQKDFPPATPGFWKSVDISLSVLPAPVGVNRIQIAHSGGGVSNAVEFVRDSFTATPAVTGGAVIEKTPGVYAYSSGVPHYGTGGQLAVDATINNFSGETYFGGSDPFTISGTNSIFTSKAVGYAALGFATPFARNTTAAEAIDQQTVDVDGAGHTSGVVSGTARNVNGTGSASLSTKIVLVKRGAAGGRIDELNVPVTGLGALPVNTNAVRVGLGTGDTPAGVPSAWVSDAALPAHEAAVVGGVLKRDLTDYSQGYLPAGPNYATHAAEQYVTFAFRRASRSAFKINVTGAYDGCWVKLPGVSDAQPNAPGGWWDATLPYDGAGVPGEAGDPLAGCASGTPMTGGSGAFTITFGTQSSTNATDNTILVRFKLAAGQSITALTFSN